MRMPGRPQDVVVIYIILKNGAIDTMPTHRPSKGNITNLRATATAAATAVELRRCIRTAETNQSFLLKIRRKPKSSLLPTCHTQQLKTAFRLIFRLLLLRSRLFSTKIALQKSLSIASHLQIKPQTLLLAKQNLFSRI